MARIRWRSSVFLTRKAKLIQYIGLCAFVLYVVSQIISGNTQNFRKIDNENEDSRLDVQKKRKQTTLTTTITPKKPPRRLHRKSEMFKQTNLSQIAILLDPVANKRHRSLELFIPVFKDPDLEKVVSYSDIFGSDKVVQDVKFPFLISNSKLCSFEEVLAVVYIHSAPGKIEERNRIRRTWASIKSDGKNRLVSFFLIGTSEDKTTMANIEHENSQFLDIVQFDAIDDYKNLTYKNLIGLKWVTEFCSQSRFVIKVDDDVLIDPFHLVDYLLHLPLDLDNFISCSVMYHIGVPKDPHDKWHIPPKDYPFRYYPSYCEGYAYIMSADMPAKMYNMSRYVPYFWIDDVYVTGFLTHRLQVRLTDMVRGHASALMTEKIVEPESTKEYIFFLGLNSLYSKYWYKVWETVKIIHKY